MKLNEHLTKRELPENSNMRLITVQNDDGTISECKGYYQPCNGFKYWYLAGGNTQVNPISWFDNENE